MACPTVGRGASFPACTREARRGVHMIEEVLFRRGSILVRRQHLSPGEALPWHRDPFHRVSVVLSGDLLAIEYRDGAESDHVAVAPGQVDWDEPTERVHRAINLGRDPYEEITVFLLDQPDAVAQPRAE
jgi:quercetin dioxygenase-like cupin family protein